ncbi:hypothetical protein B0A50_04078 [Salinomyces thailandicus]|uniref:Uncharacterized protein n=1 Tax=Salinomyces thailandicus TaxID=706561 RepID=A0A4U0U0N4_9PEZI|nr:hypothetical protein B0A50_04078 [Salinomyces thailandica]
MNTAQRPESLKHVLPSLEDIERSRATLLDHLPASGIGESTATIHLQKDVLAGLNRASESPHYYGFVTGGATPIATLADNLVTKADNSPQVHLPNETLATEVEDRALRMVCELLDLPPDNWPHRTFTTGATASNVVGLACGRDYVVQHAAREKGNSVSVAEDGMHKAMRIAGLEDLQVLTTVPHSSLRNAASIVGLGRSAVIDVGLEGKKHCFDMRELEQRLRQPGVASIVAVSCAEVNTGFFATTGNDMKHLRESCDEYGAWLHVDAAFGLLARILPANEDFTHLRSGVAGLDLADSIAGDAHKLLNVPYDCGILLSRHLSLATQVFQNSNAVYLNTASSETTASVSRSIPSPLNIGIENSRRFRALPVYASLAAYGRTGYLDMLVRQIHLARAIALFVLESADYELLPAPLNHHVTDEERLANIYIIVIFRPKNEELNGRLVRAVNATRRIYISGTQWEGKPAARFAVANWQAEVEWDLEVVKGVLLEVARSTD